MGQCDRGYAVEGKWHVWEIKADVVRVQAEEYSSFESLKHSGKLPAWRGLKQRNAPP